MPYDSRLHERIQDALERKDDWSEKNLYGGRVFLLDGQPFVGVVEGGIIAMCSDEARRRHLELKHCTPFKHKGKELDGWVKVDMEALKTAKQLSRWVEAGYTYASNQNSTS